MENYIVINGKKAELTEEQLKALGIEVKKESPFRRVNKRDNYYCISYKGKITASSEMKDPSDDTAYNIANYCTDRELLQQQAYREILNRLLWRYSMEHDGDKINWVDGSQKYYIFRNKQSGAYGTSYDVVCTVISTVHFYTKEIAQNAIEEIVKPFMAEHPDFKW